MWYLYITTCEISWYQQYQLNTQCGDLYLYYIWKRKTRDEQTMRMKTCLILILTEMEAESEEDDDDEDDDGKKVSGDVTQSWGHSCPLLSPFVTLYKCCLLSLFCFFASLSSSQCVLFLLFCFLSNYDLWLFKTVHHWFAIVFWK